MAETTTANALARKLTAQLHRNVSGKSVRAWAREHIARFGDDRYTAHDYSAAEVKAVMAAFTSKGDRSTVQPKANAPKAPKSPKAPQTAAPTE